MFILQLLVECLHWITCTLIMLSTHVLIIDNVYYRKEGHRSCETSCDYFGCPGTYSTETFQPYDYWYNCKNTWPADSAKGIFYRASSKISWGLWTNDGKVGGILHTYNGNLSPYLHHVGAWSELGKGGGTHVGNGCRII